MRQEVPRTFGRIQTDLKGSHIGKIRIWKCRDVPVAGHMPRVSRAEPQWPAESAIEDVPLTRGWRREAGAGLRLAWRGLPFGQPLGAPFRAVQGRCGDLGKRRGRNTEEDSGGQEAGGQAGAGTGIGATKVACCLGSRAGGGGETGGEAAARRAMDLAGWAILREGEELGEDDGGSVTSYAADQKRWDAPPGRLIECPMKAISGVGAGRR